jgi:hypothetical protein
MATVPHGRTQSTRDLSVLLEYPALARGKKPIRNPVLIATYPKCDWFFAHFLTVFRYPFTRSALIFQTTNAPSVLIAGPYAQGILPNAKLRNANRQKPDACIFAPRIVMCNALSAASNGNYFLSI